MSRSLAKKEAQQQQLQNSQQYARDTETKEHHASANAQGGLNLNLVGALSGALSSKSKKSTHHNADGSSDSVEERHDQALANGNAAGNANAFAAGNAQQHGKHQKSRELGQSATQGKQISGKKEYDHLGIEN